MRMHNICFVILSFWALSAYGSAVFVDLGTAAPFAVLAGSTVTNTGATSIHGNLGVWPGTSVTGFPPGIVSGGTIEAGDAAAMMAQNDLTAGYNFAVAESCGS